MITLVHVHILQIVHCTNVNFMVKYIAIVWIYVSFIVLQVAIDCHTLSLKYCLLYSILGISSLHIREICVNWVSLTGGYLVFKWWSECGCRELELCIILCLWNVFYNTIVFCSFCIILNCVMSVQFVESEFINCHSHSLTGLGILHLWINWRMISCTPDHMINSLMWWAEMVKRDRSYYIVAKVLYV